MPIVSWDELDVLPHPDNIANLMRQRGVKGKPCDPLQCPLAKVTGWLVRACSARSPDNTNPSERILTPAEIRFVDLFDAGAYPDLEDLP